MSHNPASAFLGYGYVINKYEDCPMPSHLENYDRNPEWEEWVDEFGDSEFYYPVDTYDNEICFFGIKLTSTVDTGYYEKLGDGLPIFHPDNWEKFIEEFKKFFPDDLKDKPQYILVNTFWF